MTNLHDERSLYGILRTLENELTAALALTSMAPETEWTDRREVAEALVLARELLADARAKVSPAAPTHAPTSDYRRFLRVIEIIGTADDRDDLAAAVHKALTRTAGARAVSP